jgi:Fic family protein
MARIRLPMPFSQLMNEIKIELILTLLKKYDATDIQGRYLHWDQFQWRVEKGDAPLAAWAATKFSRKLIANEYPQLEAETNRYFSFCIPESLSAQLYAIDKLAGKVISDGAFVTSGEKNLYLVKNLILEEAITSSQLEGASTTRKVAKEMLEKNLAPKDKSQQMILNNYLLMKKAVEKKDEELSIDFILELHQIATNKAIENQAVSGEFRKSNDISVYNQFDDDSFTFYPPDWQTIEFRLSQLCSFANTDHSDLANFIHPIIKAIVLHFMIAYIHPFGDGNGRTARAIFYWSILRSGYWLFEYVSISKLIQQKRGDYDKAFIYTETDEFDLTYFLYNQVDTIEKAIRSLHQHLDKKKRELTEFMNWIDKSPVAQKLKLGHLQILKEGLKSPGREFSAKQVAIEFDITESTARSYLNKLVDKDLLIKAQSKNGKPVIYFAPANLSTRLKP